MLASVHRDWRPRTRTSRLRIPMRPLSSAGGPTSSPVAARSDTNRSHLPSGMRIHADTVQVGARPIRAVVSVHPESFGNRPAYPDQSQRASASHVTMQTQSRIDAAAAPVLPGHTRSRPGLQRRAAFSQRSDGSHTASRTACIGLLWAKRRPASNIFRSRSTKLKLSIDGKTSAAAHIAVPGPAPRSSTELGCHSDASAAISWNTRQFAANVAGIRTCRYAPSFAAELIAGPPALPCL